MKVYNPKSERTVHPDLMNSLTWLRQQRGFDVRTYVCAKARLLNDYMRRCRLSACVVAVSGGADSAVVLAMVHDAAKQTDSPIRRIVPILLPVNEPQAATNQGDATARGREVCRAFGLTPHVIDLTESHAAIKRSVDTGMGQAGAAWASGQLVAYTRTPAIYYTTSLLSEAGTPAIVIGTTNRSEGAYLGYVGKASDAMVDVQLISDLHKSEVYRVGAHLGVPLSVMNVTPAGDMYDGRSDEDVFGAPYDFVELYLEYKCLGDAEKRRLASGWSEDAYSQFQRFADNLERLHAYNAHKYLVGSPAVHMNVLESAVPEGWTNPVMIPEPPRDTSKFVNHVAVDPRWLQDVQTEVQPVCAMPVGNLDQSGFAVENLFDRKSCDGLLADLGQKRWEPVGYDGIKRNYNPASDAVGSWRLSWYSAAFARVIWERISPLMDRLRVMEDTTPTDWDGSPVWRAVGVNPLMRFIRYEQGGLLVPHYDAPFIYNEDRRTLMSLVLYFNDCTAETGGATRFLKDPQAHLPVADRDLSDRVRPLDSADEIDFMVRPKQGSALIFDHRILHDSEPFAGTGQKVICRTDIVFERCIPRKQ